MKKTNKYDYETTFAIIFTVVMALLLVAIIIYNIAVGNGDRLVADFIYAVIFIGSPLICLFIAQKVDERQKQKKMSRKQRLSFFTSRNQQVLLWKRLT